MHKCLKIIFRGNLSADFLRTFIQKNAQKFSLEGTAQLVANLEQVSVIVCGDKDNIDLFLDELHVYIAHHGIEDFEVEPFLKGKDYRGVFRIIE